MADRKISEFADGGAVQPTDEIATNRGGTNTKVFVGSAAALDAGTAVGDIVQIVDVGGSPGLPVLDGSNLTGLAGGGTVTNFSISFGNGLTGTVTNPTTTPTLNADVRSLIATPVSVASGTHNVNIANGDFHQITVTGAATLSWTMANGQALMVRAINFNLFGPVLSLDWGSVGAPTWTGKDDFLVYRDVSGNYIGVVLVLGIT